jgi:hypothetical protein
LLSQQGSRAAQPRENRVLPHEWRSRRRRRAHQLIALPPGSKMLRAAAASAAPSRVCEARIVRAARSRAPAAAASRPGGPRCDAHSYRYPAGPAPQLRRSLRVVSAAGPAPLAQAPGLTSEPWTGSPEQLKARRQPHAARICALSRRAVVRPSGS